VRRSVSDLVALSPIVMAAYIRPTCKTVAIHGEK
jgi:hypothetical protein